MNEPTILVVDDDPTLLDTLAYNLRREGSRVLVARDGAAAIRLAQNESPDLIVLDLMLPGMSGLEVCRTLRRTMTTPILILSAREEEADKIAALDGGADLYLTKPFRLREFLASVRAILRRTTMHQPPEWAPIAAVASGPPEALGQAIQAGEPPSRLVISDLVVDLSGRSVWRQGKSIHLKPKEFDLLAFMLRHPGQALTRSYLLEQIWGYAYSGGSRTVDVHVSWLRNKLEPAPATPQLIQTVYSVGYKFVLPHGSRARSTELDNAAPGGAPSPAI